MSTYVFIAATLAFTTYGQLIIKYRSLIVAGRASAGRFDYLMGMATDWGVLSGLVAAVIASGCWTLAIQRTSLSIAYPFMALTFVLVPIASVTLFGDNLSTLQSAGLAIIVLGITLTALGA